MMRLREQNLLPIFIDQCHSHRSAQHHEGRRARLACLVNALSRGKLVHFDLLRQNGKLVFVEQRKQWNVPKLVSIAWHGGDSSPLSLPCDD